MGNFLNTSILIPLIPLATALFIFILLASFNRTINRLTKPVTAVIALSLLSSAFISYFYYFKKIEEELVLSKMFKGPIKKTTKTKKIIPILKISVISN